MKTLDDSRELADLCRARQEHGRATVALVTDMSQPLGRRRRQRARGPRGDRGPAGRARGPHPRPHPRARRPDARPGRHRGGRGRARAAPRARSRRRRAREVPALRRGPGRRPPSGRGSLAAAAAPVSPRCRAGPGGWLAAVDAEAIGAPPRARGGPPRGGRDRPRPSGSTSSCGRRRASTATGSSRTCSAKDQAAAEAAGARCSTR